MPVEQEEVYSDEKFLKPEDLSFLRFKSLESYTAQVQNKELKEVQTANLIASLQAVLPAQDSYTFPHFVGSSQ